MATELVIGRGTKVYVLPKNAGGNAFPEETVITTGASAASAATTITVSMAPAITGTVKAPFYVKFVDADGNEDLVKVTSDLESGDTTLTVAALTRGIASGATAEFPPIFAARESASFTNNDTTQDVQTFENNGYKAQVKTMLANSLSLNGFYSPLDAGWRNIEYARLNFKDVYFKIEYPLPNVSTGHTKGQTIEGFATPNGAPIELGSVADIAKSNVELMLNGAVTITPPT